MTRPFWLALLLLAGCAKPHPLLSQQEALTTLAQARAPAQPHAVVQIGAPLLKRLERYSAERLVREVPDRIPVDVPLMGRIQVKPGLKQPHLQLRDARCTGCVAVDGDWSGRLTAGRQGPLDWSATTRSTVALRTRSTVEGGQQLIVTTTSDQDVRVRLKGLNPVLSRLIEGIVSTEIEYQLQQGALAEPIPLLELGPAAPHVHGVTLSTAGGLAAAPSFIALHHGRVGNIPNPGEGFVAVVPSESLLGLVHAAMVWQDPVRGYAPEPVSLELHPDGTFSLGLTVWKAKRSTPKGRDYTLSGTIALQGESLVFELTDAESLSGWGGDPKAFLIDRQLRDALEGGTRFEVPAVREIQMGDEHFTARASKLQIERGQLQLFGSLEFPKLPSAKRAEKR